MLYLPIDLVIGGDALNRIECQTPELQALLIQAFDHIHLWSRYLYANSDPELDWDGITEVKMAYDDLLTDILLSPCYSEDLQEAALAFIKADLSAPSTYEELHQRFLA